MNDNTNTLALPARWLNKPAILLSLFAALLTFSAFGQPVRGDRPFARPEGRITREPSIRQQHPAMVNRQYQPQPRPAERIDSRQVQPGNSIDYSRRGNIRPVPVTPTLPRSADRYGYGNNNRYDRRGNIVNRPGNGYNPYAKNGYRPGYPNYNNYRRPVYGSYNPSWRYGHIPGRNSVFNRLPGNYLSLNFGGFNYRYFNGIYYQPYNDVFRVVAPPVGLFINTLPLGYRKIYVRDYPYYYYNGTYYDQQDSKYRVVSPPVGAVVESLPKGYETLLIDGETYFTVDGAQYKPIVQENGEIWYEVIKSNED